MIVIVYVITHYQRSYDVMCVPYNIFMNSFSNACIIAISLSCAHGVSQMYSINVAVVPYPLTKHTSWARWTGPLPLT